MKVLVPIKRVVDYHVRIRICPDGQDVDVKHAKKSINPFDEIALEEAVRLKEQGRVSAITVVSVGEPAAQEQLRTALALGADQAVWVDAPPLTPLWVAKVLHALVQQDPVDLILMGKQSIDGDNNQTPQCLAALLQCSQGTCVSKLSLQGSRIQVMRETDQGLETLSLSLPAVVSADLRLNTPRYPSLPNLMKAKKKPLKTVTLAELGLDVVPQQQRLKVSAPQPRSPGRWVKDVTELVHCLREEAKIIE